MYQTVKIGFSHPHHHDLHEALGQLRDVRRYVVVAGEVGAEGGAFDLAVLHPLPLARAAAADARPRVR